MPQSLEELKADNLANEEAGLTDEQVNKQQQDETDTEEDDSGVFVRPTKAEDDTTKTDGEAKSASAGGEDGVDTSDDDDEDKPAVTEDWMKGDTDDDGKPKQDNALMAKTRIKMRAKLKERDDELVRLRSENADLKKPAAPVTPTSLSKPNRDNFDSDDTFQDAMVDYKLDKRDADNNARFTHAQRTRDDHAKLSEVNTAVDSHYDRAVTLAEKSGISSERYQQADHNVRSMMEGLFKGSGDAITDSLISSLGEGSEKVMFKLGVSDSHLDELEKKFRSDPTGVSASMYLGKLNSELNAPRRRRTNAPSPTPTLSGDGKVGTAGEKAMRKAYQAESGKSDLTERFRLRREAKKAGFNVSDW